jgi:UDP-glucose 4-epimerase
MYMSKLLITGNRGWIGKNFTKLLDIYNIPWAGVDRLDGHWLGPSMKDILEVIDECDIVVHLAATPRIPASWTDSNRYRDNNVGVTDQLARICAEHQKHLVFASSSSVYGDGEGPLNPYSWTKLACEESIKMHSRGMGMQYTILRIFTNYGEDDPSGLVINRWINAYKGGTPLLLRGDGSQSRDFIHVSDTARALMEVCIQRPINVTLDIGTGKSHSLKNLISMFPCDYTTEPELPGYAHSTKANLEYTQSHMVWSPITHIDHWLSSQIVT